MANRRAPFTAEEKQELEKCILSKKYSDRFLAKRFCCSETTIKIIRTKKYRQLKKKRRSYSEETKKAMLDMYASNMTIIQIARQLRVKYWSVWEVVERSGLRGKERVKKTPFQHITNREFFNYSKWLEKFLSFVGKKTRRRDVDSVKEWMNQKESQKQLHSLLLEFNGTVEENFFVEKGIK